MLAKICLITALLFGSVFAEEKHEQVVILGSGPAGLTAAIYTARAGLSTLVIEGGEPGGQITLSYQVDNFPGFPEGISGFDLAENMRLQAERFGAKIEPGKVIDVDLSQRPFKLTVDEDTIITDTLIIASGASTRWLGLPSEQALIGKGVNSCAVCDGILYKGKEVFVIGGGDAALEDALFLSNYASKVTLVHRRDSFRGSKYLQDKVLENEKIKILWNQIVDEIADPEKEEVTGVWLQDVISNERKFYPTDGIFVAIGHNPNSELFKDKLEHSESGYLVSHPFSTKTNIPGIFVAGDVADAYYRQAVTAAGTGCMAAIDAYHFIKQNEE